VQFTIAYESKSNQTHRQEQLIILKVGIFCEQSTNAAPKTSCKTHNIVVTSGMRTSLKSLDISYPLLLDGGLSNQLEKQGCRLDDPLWTALMIKTNPREIVKAHLAYLNAGAQCIITSSYQATIPGFKARGIDSLEAEKLILQSVDLAKEAVSLYLSEHPANPTPLIAASIGPYGAYLADGSEYTGDYGISIKELRIFHEQRIELLDGSDADILACETIPSFKETQALADLLHNCTKQAWLSFSCRDDHYINDGTPIEKCIELLQDHAKVFALGVNCTKPQYITALINTIKLHAGDKRIVAYPNSGEKYLPGSRTWEEVEDECFSPAMVQEWVNAGADIVGGCCRVGPDMIRKVYDELTCFRHG
jgi:homocysteine S-methyltransferase